MSAKPLTVIGLLGSQLDRGKRADDRWASWRPSVAICQQDDLVVDRFDLLCERRFTKLADQVAADIRTISPETDLRLHPIRLEDPWDFEEVYAVLHQFAREQTFDTDTSDYLVHITTGTHVAQICLFLLVESRRLPARLLQTSPPPGQRRRGTRTDPSTPEPAGDYQIIDLDLSRYDGLAARFGVEHDEAQSILKRGIATRDEAFNRLIDRIEQVSLATTAPILLTGPTGSGKTHLAGRIHTLLQTRRRIDGPLVDVNCATLRGDAAMSTLFGHVKGAFTGAASKRDGLLRSADGGMLFLDESGELGPDEQAMLLRAIEDKIFLPVGADRPVHSDFQLIAGTNRDLAADVVSGRFREDLLARINLWTFELPGLCDRRDDIDPNLDYELQQFAATNGRHITISREARGAFLRFARDATTPWRSNFRDLNAAVTRMATLAPGGRITTETVADEIRRLQNSWRSPETSATNRRVDDPTVGLLSEATRSELDLFDRLQLESVIDVCRRHPTLSSAGRELYQASRRTKAKPNDADRLKKYLARYGLTFNDIGHHRTNNH